jgi:hypothetical protein
MVVRQSKLDGLIEINAQMRRGLLGLGERADCRPCQ